MEKISLKKLKINLGKYGECKSKAEKLIFFLFMLGLLQIFNINLMYNSVLLLFCVLYVIFFVIFCHILKFMKFLNNLQNIFFVIIKSASTILQ